MLVFFFRKINPKSNFVILYWLPLEKEGGKGISLEEKESGNKTETQWNQIEGKAGRKGKMTDIHPVFIVWG